MELWGLSELRSAVWNESEQYFEALVALGNLPKAVLILSAGPLVAAVLIAAAFPETGGRELEDINVSAPLPMFSNATADSPQ